MISTYDFRFDFNRRMLFLVADASPASFASADLGTDADNVWTDGALVDAHVYAGWVYDYFYKRFGRRGLDNNNVAVPSVTHAFRREDWRTYINWVGTLLHNAIYLGEGVMYYGDGLPPDVFLVSGSSRQQVSYLAGALDIVSHELSHGVTEYTSNLVYQDESRVEQVPVASQCTTMSASASPTSP